MPTLLKMQSEGSQLFYSKITAIKRKLIDPKNKTHFQDFSNQLEKIEYQLMKRS